MRYYFSSVLALLFILSCVTVALCLDTAQIQIMKQISDYVYLPTYSSRWTDGSSDPCRWDGVHCRKNGGGNDVVELHLSGFWFSDNIWQTVCMLPALQILHLSHAYDYLRTPTPEDIKSCTSLVALNLSYNDMSGSLPSLNPLQNLQSLDMSYNYFYGDFGLQIQNLTDLRILNLNQNSLSGAIPVELSNITALESLNLSDNGLIGPIPDDIGSLVNLKTLLLSSNFFSGSIPKTLGNLTKLTHLAMNQNSLRGAIPVELSNITALESLDLYGNSLIGPLPDSIGSLVNLKTLLLSSNLFSGIIPKTLGNLTNLTHLAMNQNMLFGAIPVELSNITALKSLNLSYNGLSGSVPPEVFSLSNMLTLDLTSNLLSGGIPPNLSRNLLNLSIGNNKLNGTIPEQLANCTELQVLDLGHNDLRGALTYVLPKLLQLQILILSNNKFEGVIPDELSNLSYLEYLDLSGNLLSGSISSEISRLKKLQNLRLQNNRLTGGIPLSIRHAKFLVELQLGKNNLTGKIPPGIPNLYMLTALNLSRNSLEGRISTSLSSLVRVETLDFSNNRLTGEIPVTLASMKSLIILDLSNNELTGTIPEAISNMEILFLNLSNNHLTESTTEAKRRFTSMIKVLGAIGLVAVFVVCCLVLGFLRIRKLQRQGFDLSQAIRKILQKVEHPRISYEELVTATNRFNRSNLIAASSFGSVYKGILTDGTPVAVKVLNLMNEDSDKSFKAECKVLQKVRHRNLARIITTCSNLHFKALIFEYFPSGSLERHLYPDRHHELGLKEVVSIAIDIAHAVEYLHYDCCVQIVHCDIKPSNVLLDEDMTAHLSDFGIARLMGRSSVDSQTSTMDLKGSVGYIAPEYGLSGMMSPRGDVYSYGILLLEMLVRKRPTDSMFEGGLNLHMWVKSAFPSRIVEVVEKSLVCEGFGKETEECLISLIRIGLLCSSDSAEARPTMREVSSMLKNIEEDWTQGTSSSIKLRPSISNLICDRGTTIDCVEASDTQSSTF